MDTKGELDLSGKVIIKVQLGDDIRRIPIHNEAITYDELVLMMQRIFHGKLNANDDITIKYKDEDGDLITIFDSSDLSFAIQCSRVLKLQILMTGSDVAKETSVSKVPNVVSVKVHLRQIRDHVNKLLDSLDSSQVPHSSENVEGHGEPASTDTGPVPNNVINKVNSSEFDPLQEKNQEHPDTSKDRTETPQTGNSVEVPENRPQSVPAAPTPSMPSGVPNQIPHDYYGATPTAGYPQMPYTSVAYPTQQYTYNTTGYGQPMQHPDHSQVPPSASPYSSNVQPNVPYPTQPQQQYNSPVTGYQGVNPYSKNYTSPAHEYMQPR